MQTLGIPSIVRIFTIRKLGTTQTNNTHMSPVEYILYIIGIITVGFIVGMIIAHVINKNKF